MKQLYQILVLIEDERRSLSGLLESMADSINVLMSTRHDDEEEEIEDGRMYQKSTLRGNEDF